MQLQQLLDSARINIAEYLELMTTSYFSLGTWSLYLFGNFNLYWIWQQAVGTCYVQFLDVVTARGILPKIDSNVEHGSPSLLGPWL
jgi:hypothetical protein